jgi:phosphatidylglycerophosphate synthase
MSASLRAYAANALTGLRVLLTPIFVSLVASAGEARLRGWLAGIVFAIIAATDVADGRSARRWGASSNAGRTFDHLADIAFILCALSAYALLGIAPWWVPAAVAGSFGFYVLDSWLSTAGAPTLIGSRIGHTAGVCNYVLVGVLVFNDSAHIGALSPAFLDLLFWLVPLYSTAAVVSRLTARRLAISLPDAA